MNWEKLIKDILGSDITDKLLDLAEAKAKETASPLDDWAVRIFRFALDNYIQPVVAGSDGETAVGIGPEVEKQIEAICLG